MDINDLRSAITLVSALIFAGIAAWAWRPSRRAAFDDAARLPLEDDVARGARR
ncbi:cbb3-type cytochrome oxidase subunit 3 [Ideonella sp. BN130291]|uniref:cbb3-type cytochrome oxidase subunit 3 n=1 Tax=Ideonella sp. BN130291 TaxID=3112940 RepID=UPI002E26438C|nr:cbb3-type cytochrome c oxidase subunit 3 [Ideonella sp. BN130291]